MCEPLAVRGNPWPAFTGTFMRHRYLRKVFRRKLRSLMEMRFTLGEKEAQHSGLSSWEQVWHIAFSQRKTHRGGYTTCNGTTFMELFRQTRVITWNMRRKKKKNNQQTWGHNGRENYLELLLREISDHIFHIKTINTAISNTYCCCLVCTAWAGNKHLDPSWVTYLSWTNPKGYYLRQYEFENIKKEKKEAAPNVMCIF